MKSSRVVSSIDCIHPLYVPAIGIALYTRRKKTVHGDASGTQDDILVPQFISESLSRDFKYWDIFTPIGGSTATSSGPTKSMPASRSRQHLPTQQNRNRLAEKRVYATASLLNQAPLPTVIRASTGPDTIRESRWDSETVVGTSENDRRHSKWKHSSYF